MEESALVPLTSSGDISRIIPHKRRRDTIEGGEGDKENIASSPNRRQPAAATESTLGVRLLWVAKENRRCGVAKRLLDCARKQFSFGSVVPRGSVAFAQPTREGFAFAANYCGGNGSILGY